MYILNWKQQSNVSNLFEEMLLVADDDNTPIQDDQCIVIVQMWARSARGYGDQTQFFGNWPYVYGGGYNAVPSFTAATNDGTGNLTLYDGVLTLNIQTDIMQRLLPGYYELGMTISDPDQTFTAQLAVGVVPVFQGLVWNYGGTF